ncbi:unnamed protein product [Prorocentrum cordatum]|uniref:Uncharacterized protein n=1 Tax=Prorocentrum cordatum TaxID=2364126 RepID=A0ABN9RFA4_9DINO|nr:unnamed protein product [Polarella glacialis]
MASDACLQVLALLYQLMDVTRTTSAVMHMKSMLLARKHKGPGRRGIAFFSATLWVKGKIFGRECKDWEANQGIGPHFSTTQRRSPEDTVWRQSMRSELAAGKGHHILKILWDQKSYCETTDHVTMVKQLEYTRTQLTSLFNLHVYRWPRRLLLDGCASACKYPRRGQFLAQEVLSGLPIGGSLGRGPEPPRNRLG